MNLFQFNYIAVVKYTLKKMVGNLFKFFGLKLVRLSTYELIFNQSLNISQRAINCADFLTLFPEDKKEKISQLFMKSKSQLGQDLFVLAHLDFSKNGYFVEFGATNGIELSNTYLLEKEFGWNGILAEPAKCWHDELKSNRSSHIEFKCIWNTSNETVLFNEVSEAEFSTINKFNYSDEHFAIRKQGSKYKVETISINDLLKKYDAPQSIDYLSIDTEGSELSILESLDFKKYSFKVITVEHNFTSAREKILLLMNSHGYVRVFENQSRWDDWYIKSKFLESVLH